MTLWLFEMMVEDMWLMASDRPFPLREDVDLFLRQQLPGRLTPAFDKMDEAECHDYRLIGLIFAFRIFAFPNIPHETIHPYEPRRFRDGPGADII